MTLPATPTQELDAQAQLRRLRVLLGNTHFGADSGGLINRYDAAVHAEKPIGECLSLAIDALTEINLRVGAYSRRAEADQEAHRQLRADVAAARRVLGLTNSTEG